MGRTILITGGAGFVGSHLADPFAPRVRRRDGLVERAGWLQSQVAEDRVLQAREELAARGLAV